MRECDVKLIDFCAKQYIDFKQDDWLARHTELSINIAALLLLGTDWYGRKQELSALYPLISLKPSSLPDTIKLERFDTPRFMSMLKKRVSLL